jgi:hypothetical protein
MNLGEQNRRKPTGNLSITRHPLFPAIVGLWFAALFGLGSIAVRPGLIEQLVVSLGIDQVIPMAAPPLGTTFRILLALGMAVAGGAIGLLLARRIARPAGETFIRKRGATPAQEASVEPGKTPLPDFGFAGRRRGLTARDAMAASDSFAERAPLPGGSSKILNVTDFDLEGFEHVEDDKAMKAEVPADPFDTGNPFAETSAHAGPLLDTASEDAQTFTSLTAEEQRAEDALAQALTPIGDAASLEEVEATPPASDDDPLNNRLFETYSRAISLRAEFAAASASPSPFGPRDPALSPETGDSETSDFATSQVTPAPTAAERIAGANLDALSHVELLERLGVALERKRCEAELRAEATKADAATPVVAAPEYAPPPYEMLAPDQADGSDSAPSSAPEPAVWEIPAALRPVGFDHADEDSEALPGYVPPRHIGLSAAEPDETDEDVTDEDSRVLEEGYSSLLGLARRPAPRQQFVPLDETAQNPAVVTPFEAAAPQDQPQEIADYSAPNAQETERALRAALATLQRMSGTA